MDRKAKLFRRGLRLGLLFLAGIVLAGCAGLPFRGEPPRLNLVGVKVVESGLLEQRYVLRLRVANLNDKDLRLDGLNFELFLNGKSFATGLSNQAIDLPRLGEAVVEAYASSSTFGLYRQLLTLGRSRVLSYKLVGKVRLKGYAPLPFVREGEIWTEPGGQELISGS